MLKSWFNQNLEGGGYRKSLFAIFTSFLPKSTWKMFAKKCSKDTFENPPTFWRILQKWKIFHNSFRNTSKLSRNIFLTSWDHMVAQKSHWKGLNLYFHSVWRFGRHYSDIVPTLDSSKINSSKVSSSNPSTIKVKVLLLTRSTEWRQNHVHMLDRGWATHSILNLAQMLSKICRVILRNTFWNVLILWNHGMYLKWFQTIFQWILENQKIWLEQACQTIWYKEHLVADTFAASKGCEEEEVLEFTSVKDFEFGEKVRYFRGRRSNASISRTFEFCFWMPLHLVSESEGKYWELDYVCSKNIFQIPNDLDITHVAKRGWVWLR